MTMKICEHQILPQDESVDTAQPCDDIIHNIVNNIKTISVCNVVAILYKYLTKKSQYCDNVVTKFI